MLTSIHEYFKNIDKFLLFLTIACSAYGMILINSATATYGSESFLLVQGLAILIGLVAFIVISLIDVDHFAVAWKFLFIVNVLLQLSLFIFGTGAETTGHNSWIRFFGIGMQPGEIGKILFIFTFSMNVVVLRDRMNNIKYLFLLLLHAGSMIGLILITSGDLGMALAYIAITGIILFVGGLSYKWFLGAIISALALIPILWNFILKDYHKLRILVIFDPSLDPDTAYQGIQSQTAIGAGGLTGSGYMQGNLTQLNWLPAKHTDFIFSVGAEEFGFVGACLIVALLLMIILRIFYVCFKAPTFFSMLICAGVGGMLLFQVAQNILMCLGLTPVIGLTLPLFSYGGTSMVVMYLAIGIVAGIYMREKPKYLKV